MAAHHVRVSLLDSEYVRGILFAAVDLLCEVEDADEALIPDSVAESAAAFREMLRPAIEGDTH